MQGLEDCIHKNNLLLETNVKSLRLGTSPREFDSPGFTKMVTASGAKLERGEMVFHPER